MSILIPNVNKIFFKKEAFLERRLPGPGEINAKVGETVSSFDVLGSTYISLDKSEWHLPSKEWRILVTDGEKLAAGSLLAKRKKILPFNQELLRMPFAGTVAVSEDKNFINLKAESTPERFNLIAGVNARVAKIIEKSSVLLSSEAYIIKGVHGQGVEVIGEVKIVGSFDTPLMLSSISPALTGKIVIGGSYATPEVVSKAQAIGVVGLILGGISGQRSTAKLPILVTEGFGKIPMNRKLWQFFTESELRTVVLSPGRRQLIVPSSFKEKYGNLEKSYLGELKVGAEVQIYVWPEFGSFGTVVAFEEKMQKFTSGIEDYPVKVRLDSGSEIDVPLSNLGLV